MSSIDLAIRFKREIYSSTREKRCNDFPRSTDVIKVVNELPTDRRYINVPQDIRVCPTHVDNKKI